MQHYPAGCGKCPETGTHPGFGSQELLGAARKREDDREQLAWELLPEGDRRSH